MIFMQQISNDLYENIPDYIIVCLSLQDYIQFSRLSSCIKVRNFEFIFMNNISHSIALIC